jgi:hypothetical protein
MKKLINLFFLVSVPLSVIAQAPQKMCYQCVIRNASCNLVTNQSVGVKISILQGSASGTLVYQETFNPNPQTNANGLLSLEIGTGGDAGFRLYEGSEVRLHIFNNSAAGGLHVENNELATAVFIQQSSANVGIGNTTPFTNYR